MKKVKLSSVEEGGIVSFGKHKAIVTNRYSEDRVSGGTVILFSDGSTEHFVWDNEDPMVRYLGHGKVHITFVPDQSKETP